MIKYSLADIKLKTPGVQIREKIIAKYDSIKNFAEEIDLYESSIHQYLSSKTLGSSTFKIRTTRAFECDFNELFETDEEQISRFVSTMSEYIDAYNHVDDIHILNSLKKVVLEKELFEDYAVVCRCFAYYFYNQGLNDRAFAYIEVAVNTMRGRENIDRFGLYFSDMILMKSNYYSTAEFKKITKEFNEVIQKVTGPLTTGHMYRNFAKAYYRLGDLKTSAKYYKKVLSYHFDDKSISFIYMCLGDIKREMDDYDEALKYYKASEKLIEDTDDDIFHVYDEYARYYIHREEFEKAEVYMNKIFSHQTWQIASSDHKFIGVYNTVKVNTSHYDDIKVVLSRLLKELDSGYIYAAHQIKKFGESLYELDCPSELVSSLLETTVSYYKQTVLSTTNQQVVKTLLGDLTLQ